MLHLMAPLDDTGRENSAQWFPRELFGRTSLSARVA